MKYICYDFEMTGRFFMGFNRHEPTALSLSEAVKYCKCYGHVYIYKYHSGYIYDCVTLKHAERTVKISKL